MFNRPSRTQAFSLIELLVVVSVLVVLVALLLPVLRQARAHAQQVGCAANLRQIGLLQIAYRTDNKQWFNPLWAMRPDPVTGTLHNWPFPARLSTYAGVRRPLGDAGREYSGWDPNLEGHHLFFCPSEPIWTHQTYIHHVSGAWRAGAGWSTPAPVHTNYILSTYNQTSGLGYHETSTDTWHRPKRGLTHPGRAMIHVDGYREPRVDHSFRFIAPRHQGQVNVLFADNHLRLADDVAMNTLFADRAFHLYDPPTYRYTRH